MKFFFNAVVLALCSLFFSSCLNDGLDEPITIIDPPANQLVGSDTISTGSFSGFTVGQSAESAYANVQTLQDSKGVTFLNVISNYFSDVAKLEGRLPLYQSLYLDEAKGSTAGVQIAFGDGKVRSIFQNDSKGGKQINQWPAGLPASSSVATGDMVDAVYGKLLKISKLDAHKSKLERMLLLTKDVSKGYDSNLALSPQWYFVYQMQGGRWGEAKLNFADGNLSSLIVNQYKQW